MPRQTAIMIAQSRSDLADYWSAIVRSKEALAVAQDAVETMHDAIRLVDQINQARVLISDGSRVI